MDDLVSVVVLNWNGRGFIEGCIESVLSQDYEHVELIVVDNSSEDGSPAFIKERYRTVRLIENKRNLGFGGGNNIGIRHSRGSYVVIMNNDVELDRYCISEMKTAIEKDKRFGACASRIYLKGERDVLDAAGIVVCPDGLSIGRGRLEPGYFYDRDEEVFFASGCCALYRKEMLEDIKVREEYYDEDFFAYADDTDLGWRARLRGWGCIYNPRAKAYHLHSASSENYSPLKAFLVERNRMLLQIKCFPLLLVAYGLAYTTLRYLYQAYGALRGRGAAGQFTKVRPKGELVRILVRAYWGAFKEFPRMTKKRSEIQKRRTTSTREILGLLRRYGTTPREIAFKC